MTGSWKNTGASDACARGGVFVRLIAMALLFAGMILPCNGCTCWEVEKPDYFESLEVSGTPYERGFQHGQYFQSKIRSLYTMLLETSIFPYLNRERDDVSSVLLRYQDDDIYGNGKFAPVMMLEAGNHLLETMKEEYIEEMRGIADGSGMSFDQILVLNTFFDTLNGFRSITFFIKLIQGPSLLSVEILADLESDGKDNDSDGEIDETGEGLLDPYDPNPYASFVEIPTDAKIRYVIDDERDGVDPDSIRIQVDEKLYLAGHESIVTNPVAREGKTIEVIFTPPGGFPEASDVSILLQCYDLNEYVRVAPHHPRSMRDQRITITTQGYGKETWEVGNRGVDDGRTQPPALGFSVRGSATEDDKLYVAHHMAMLDSGFTHKHVTLIIHHPDDGKPFAVLGYPGLIWGFSGINRDGLTYFFNMSDTLNNSFAANFNEGLIFAKMLPDGVPVGFMGRDMLQGMETVDQAVDYLGGERSTFGWNFILGDKLKDMIAVELDGNMFNEPDGGIYTYTSDPNDSMNRDPYGNMYASVGPDDLRVASHFQKNVNEVDYQIVNFPISPQRVWTGFYFRSLKAFYNMGDRIEDNYGRFNLQNVVKMLRAPELTDDRDSMMAAIYEPEAVRIYVAAGKVPATDAPFEAFDLAEIFQAGEAE